MREPDLPPKHPDLSVSFMDSSRRQMHEDADPIKLPNDKAIIFGRKKSEATPKSLNKINEDLDENAISKLHIPLQNEEKVSY
jgi:hypothetical protein